MSITRRVAVVAMVVFVSAGCWRASKSGAAAFDEETTVLVENHNWLEMVVYALRGADRIRLGNVSTGGSAEFRLPRGFTTGSNITLVADPIGSRTLFRSEPLAVAPGRLLRLRIENNIRQSSVSMR